MCADKPSTIAWALDTARTIASKSPLALYGIKRNLLYSRDHSVKDSLEYVATWNAAALQTEDVMKSFVAIKTKKNALYAKL